MKKHIILNTIFWVATITLFTVLSIICTYSLIIPGIFAIANIGYTAFIVKSYKNNKKLNLNK